MNNNWHGYILDGSKRNIRRVLNSNYYWKYDLRAMSAFITADNIDQLLQESGFAQDVGLMSIDVDGVDYWILSAIEYVQPRILILEYNALFGSDRAITVPYRNDFDRSKAHFSNLYFGASLPALVHLAEQKGFSFVGTNSAGVNAFFVRNDLVGDLTIPILNIEDGFTNSKLRQSRDRNGNLNFLRENEALNEIKGMPVINVLTGGLEEL